MIKRYVKTSAKRIIPVIMLLLTGVSFAESTNTSAIRDIDWHPDGRLAVGYDNGTIEILNSVGELINTIVVPGGIYTTIDWNPTNDQLAVASNGPVHIVDTVSGDILTLAGSSTFLVQWSPDGTMLAGNSKTGLDVPRVIILEIHTDELLPPMDKPYARSLTALEWSPDGSLIVAGYGTGLVVIWDVATGQEVSEWSAATGTFISGLDWSPDGTRIVTGTSGSGGRVWDVETGQELLHFHYARDGVAWSPDGTRLAIIDATDLYIRNAVTGELLETTYVGGFLRAVAWSPDGSQVAYGGNTQTNTVQIVSAPPVIIDNTPPTANANTNDEE